LFELPAGSEIEPLPAWGEWIEIIHMMQKGRLIMRSLPAWGEWIEIKKQKKKLKSGIVSPRMGRVD